MKAGLSYLAIQGGLLLAAGTMFYWASTEMFEEALHVFTHAMRVLEVVTR